ncbi:MAG: peptidase domain-containing ABC transporter [Rhodospirillales bacterium]|nr:peptidase domain-containing ABC transporter [Rhodospirillales bacterium]
MGELAKLPGDTAAERRDAVTQNSILRAFTEVASRCGVTITVEHLRRTYVLSAGHIDNQILVAMARDGGLDARAVKTKWSDMPRLKKSLPAILRLKDGTALVLESVREDPTVGRVVVLSDPTTSSDAMVAFDEGHLMAVWDGDIILVKRRFTVADQDRPFGLAWLIWQALSERRLFADIAAAALVSTVFAMAPPFIFMIVMDRVLTNHSMSTLIVIGVVLILIVAFETALGHLRRFFTEIATTRIDGRLNLYILEKMLALPMEYFEKNPTGMILSKLGRIWQIRNFLTGQMFGTILDLVPLVGLIPALVILNWKLSLFVFTLTTVVFIIVLVFVRPIGRKYARVVRAEQAKGAHLVESIYGMKTIKSLALEGRRRQEWDRLVAQSISARHDLGLLANYPTTMTLPFERMIYSGSLLLGAWLMLTNPASMGAGAMIAFAMLSMRLSAPLIRLARLQQDLAEVRGAIGEVASIMNTPPEQSRAGTGLRLPVKGAISFQDVRFRYAPAAPLALDGVSFDVACGQMIGIMGRSGSGKTTVTRLLQGLNPAYEGIIKIDGMDLREIDLAHLRTNIGVVPQENFLFSGSIRENIAIAKPGASFTEIVRAAQLAGAEEFIERLPRGYDTGLQEGATNLSGGQRQRLAIARALLIDPPVLILDEATSALDAESETIINANLQRIAQGRTIICISHRLSMLVPADAIIVLERGKVYDIGRHEELLHRCDIYKHLWFQQNRHIDRGAAHVPLAIARSPNV